VGDAGSHGVSLGTAEITRVQAGFPTAASPSLQILFAGNVTRTASISGLSKVVKGPISNPNGSKLLEMEIVWYGIQQVIAGVASSQARG